MPKDSLAAERLTKRTKSKGAQSERCEQEPAPGRAAGCVPALQQEQLGLAGSSGALKRSLAAAHQHWRTLAAAKQTPSVALAGQCSGLCALVAKEQSQKGTGWYTANLRRTA
jgi:hypothetical protein